jgi:hypothetical protein
MTQEHMRIRAPLAPALSNDIGNNTTAIALGNHNKDNNNKSPSAAQGGQADGHQQAKVDRMMQRLRKGKAKVAEVK